MIIFCSFRPIKYSWNFQFANFIFSENNILKGLEETLKSGIADHAWTVNGGSLTFVETRQDNRTVEN